MSPITDPNYAAEKQRRYRERRRALDDLEDGELNDAAVSSFVKAAIATGMAALDKTTRAADYVRDDPGAGLVLRAAVTPTSVAGSPALSAIAMAFLDALTPASAGIDLLRRGVQLNF